MKNRPSSLSIGVDYGGHPAFSQQRRPVTASAHWSDQIQAIDDAILRVRREVPEALDDGSAFVNLVCRPVADLFLSIRQQSDTPPDFHRFLTILEGRTLDNLCCEMAYVELKAGLPEGVTSPQELADAVCFLEDGYFVAKLDPDRVQEFSRFLDPFKAEIRKKYAEGCTDRASLSFNEFDEAAKVRLRDLLDTRGISRCVSNARSEVLKVTGFALELSVPGAVWWRSRYRDLECESEKTVYFHTDMAPDYMKAILYLTDAGPDSGAATVIPESYHWHVGPLQLEMLRVIDGMGHAMEYPDLSLSQPELESHLLSSELGRSHFLSLPPELRNVSHFGNDIVPGSDLEEEYLRKSHVLVGDVGTVLAFNGSRVAHRGGLVRNGERWACQIIFGRDRCRAQLLQARWREELRGGRP